MRMLLSIIPSRAPLLASALCLSVAASLSGCANPNPLMEQSGDTATGVHTTSLSKSERVLWVLSPYKIDIQQGNFVSKEMAAQLKEGMTRDQVKFALGTPILTDIFHADRWDYVFSLKKGNGDMITSRVTVFFKDNHVVRFEGGDNLPSETEYLARIASSKPLSDASSAATSPTTTKDK